MAKDTVACRLPSPMPPHATAGVAAVSGVVATISIGWYDAEIQRTNLSHFRDGLNRISMVTLLNYRRPHHHFITVLALDKFDAINFVEFRELIALKYPLMITHVITSCPCPMHVCTAAVTSTHATTLATVSTISRSPTTGTSTVGGSVEVAATLNDDLKPIVALDDVNENEPGAAVGTTLNSHASVIDEVQSSHHHADRAPIPQSTSPPVPFVTTTHLNASPAEKKLKPSCQGDNRLLQGHWFDHEYTSLVAHDIASSVIHDQINNGGKRSKNCHRHPHHHGSLLDVLPVDIEVNIISYFTIQFIMEVYCCLSKLSVVRRPYHWANSRHFWFEVPDLDLVGAMPQKKFAMPSLIWRAHRYLRMIHIANRAIDPSLFFTPGIVDLGRLYYIDLSETILTNLRPTEQQRTPHNWKDFIARLCRPASASSFTNSLRVLYIGWTMTSIQDVVRLLHDIAMQLLAEEY
jgi:hypothetical protein